MSPQSPLGTSLQGRCHGWLAENTAEHGPLGFRAPQIELPDTGERQRIIDEIISADVRDPDLRGDRQGRAAVITAGPPGVGKSEAIRQRGEQLASFRHIDPDAYKDRLLDGLQRRGYLRDLDRFILPDGRPVAPREVSNLVHRDSVIISDEIRATSLARGENFIIEGTMSWDGIVDQMTGEFTDHDYQQVLIIDGEASRERTQLQARRRWWRARRDPQRADDQRLGGRFVHPDAIDALYQRASEGVTPTGRHARQVFDQLSAEGLAVELETRRVDAHGRVSTTTETTLEATSEAAPVATPAASAIGASTLRPVPNQPETQARGDGERGESSGVSVPERESGGAGGPGVRGSSAAGGACVAPEAGAGVQDAVARRPSSVAGGEVRCAGCGRPLRSAESIARGYGPSCAGRASGS